MVISTPLVTCDVDFGFYGNVCKPIAKSCTWHNE